MNNWIEIAEVCEAVSGPNMNVDIAMSFAFAPNVDGVAPGERENPAQLRHFTSSMSEAMSLVDPAQPFILTNVDTGGGEDYTKWRCEILIDEDDFDAERDDPPPCATPELAVCAALLRMKARKEGGKNGRS